MKATKEFLYHISILITKYIKSLLSTYSLLDTSFETIADYFINIMAKESKIHITTLQR